MAGFQNEFSFSFSRHAQLQECPRQYYWRRYGYWNGWKESAPKSAQRAYRLKNLSSPEMHMGNVVHNFIAEDLRRIRAGNPRKMSPGQVNDLVHREVERGYEQSSQLAFLQDKNAVTFAGDFYESMNRWLKPPEQMIEKGQLCVRNYLSSPIRAYLLRNPQFIHMVEDLKDCTVANVKVYVQMDLVMRSKKVSHFVVDWKTGKRSKTHRHQLALYALYLHDELGVPLHQIQTGLLYLAEGPDEMEEHPRFSGLEIEDVRARIKEEVAQEVELLDGPVSRNVPKPITSFPMNKGSACKFCVYRELCDVEKSVLDETF